MKIVRNSLICVLGLFALVTLSNADNTVVLPEPSAEQGLTYEKNIRSIFEQNCFKCHGDKKQKGELRLDSLESALNGSEDGKVIIPGKSDQSPLVLAVARVDKDKAMPPKTSLKTEEVSLIRAWIDQGAK